MKTHAFISTALLILGLSLIPNKAKAAEQVSVMLNVLPDGTEQVSYEIDTTEFTCLLIQNEQMCLPDSVITLD
jgi:hypothetical protein